MPMLLVRKVLSATNTDVLSGTDIDSLPGPGRLTVYAASDQDDSTMTITGTGVVAPVNGQPIQGRATGKVSKNTDIPIIIGNLGRGGHVTISVTEVTATVTGIEVIAVYEYQ